MASKFQSRLVGTIILVAIGVIVLPDVFDGKKLHYQEEFASIPIKPDAEEEIETFEVLEPVDFSAELPDEPVSVAIDDNDDPQIVINEVEPVNNYQKSAWIVQLGVFRNFDNAHQLVAKLREQGFQAHVYPKQPEPGDLARVVVGPDISRDQLESELPKLEKLTGLKGRMMKFNPLNP